MTSQSGEHAPQGYGQLTSNEVQPLAAHHSPGVVPRLLQVPRAPRSGGFCAGLGECHRHRRQWKPGSQNFPRVLLTAPSSFLSARRLPDVSVITVDSAPFSGTFHFVAVDDPLVPQYVYVSDTLRHVIRRKDLQTGGCWGAQGGC